METEFNILFPCDSIGNMVPEISREEERAVNLKSL
jgi:hypothetical protein